MQRFIFTTETASFGIIQIHFRIDILQLKWSDIDTSNVMWEFKVINMCSTATHVIHPSMSMLIFVENEN